MRQRAFERRLPDTRGTHQDPGLMQLIETDVHRQTDHTAGFSR